MHSAYKLNKQGDNIQPWRTPFPIWNQSVVPCPLLTVASWPAYRFLKRQVRWSRIPISFRIFHILKVYKKVMGSNSAMFSISHLPRHTHAPPHTHTTDIFNDPTCLKNHHFEECNIRRHCEMRSTSCLSLKVRERQNGSFKKNLNDKILIVQHSNWMLTHHAEYLPCPSRTPYFFDNQTLKNVGAIFFQPVFIWGKIFSRISHRFLFVF